MQIRKKSNVRSFLNSFSHLAESNSAKLYFIFPWEYNGMITIMKYADDSYSIHRLNDLLWDLHEITMTEKEIEVFLWNHRRFINPVLRGLERASSIK